MSKSVLGKLIAPTDDVARDAEHVAIAPCYAGEDLFPGQHIGFREGNTDVAWSSNAKHIGIVDPFLTHKIPAGEQFHMCMYPNTYKALRHAWTHPVFEEVKKK
jgi:hypothetical protein